MAKLAGQYLRTVAVGTLLAPVALVCYDYKANNCYAPYFKHLNKGKYVMLEYDNNHTDLFKNAVGSDINLASNKYKFIIHSEEFIKLYLCEHKYTHAANYAHIYGITLCDDSYVTSTRNTWKLCFQDLFNITPYKSKSNYESILAYNKHHFTNLIKIDWCNTIDKYCKDDNRDCCKR